MAEISDTPAGQNVNAEEPAGAEQPVSTEQPKDVQPGQTGKEVSKDARMWAMFCHLAGLARFIVPVIISGIIAPLIVWQIKKDDYPFVDEQGKEAVNFQISMSICALVSIALIPVFCIGAFLLAAVEIVDLVFLLIAAVKANNGEHYRYPLTIRFIK
jgi:uncharacterized Tic20 family protein